MESPFPIHQLISYIQLNFLSDFPTTDFPTHMDWPWPGPKSHNGAQAALQQKQANHGPGWPWLPLSPKHLAQAPALLKEPETTDVGSQCTM